MDSGGAMTTVTVELTRPYDVVIGQGSLQQLGERLKEQAIRAGTKILVVSNPVVAEHYGATVMGSLSAAGYEAELLVIEAGEEQKTPATVAQIHDKAYAMQLERSSLMLALGGGVVGDLAGFLAASYQRGVRLVQVPTTLLAMVDSSLGGKTGVDLPEGKNYVGAVYQPEAVVMDPVVLGTLPARELSCGFAEVVKYGLLVGGDLMEIVAAWPELPGPDDALADLIRRCADCKLEVVAEDEMDLGRRAILNLGHTVGHGIEAAGGYDLYHHGEAISLGLLAALRVSERELGLDPTWRRRTADTLGRHGLPVNLDPSVDVDRVIEIMGRDKKSDGRALNMVLLRAPGDVLTHQDPDPAVVRAAVEELVP